MKKTYLERPLEIKNFQEQYEGLKERQDPSRVNLSDFNPLIFNSLDYAFRNLRGEYKTDEKRERVVRNFSKLFLYDIITSVSETIINPIIPIIKVTLGVVKASRHIPCEDRNLENNIAWRV